MHLARAAALVGLSLMIACTRFGAVYPSRPGASPGVPAADPVPSRIVAHVSMSAAALRASLDEVIPKTGTGDFTVLKSQRHYTWDRSPLELSFSQGRIVIDARIHTNVALPVGSLDFPMDLHVLAEPVVTPEYKVSMQSTDVKITSTDRRLIVADHVAGVFETVGAQVNAKLKDFSYDLRPTLEEAYARIAKPIELPIGETKGCAELRVLGVEAGPTILANGIEKDLAIIVAPSVTLPCGGGVTADAKLPPLANVPLVASGPFTVTIPIAARYEELTRAMSMAFTDGKLHFSTEFPELYLENPELYESQGQLVLKLHIAGPVHKFGIDTVLDGDLFLSGHIAVVDNELRIPDLEPTIETSNFLLSLKAMADGAKIRDQARAALRLDIGERLHAVRAKLSSDLTFAAPQGCFKGDVDKIEVTGAYPHGSYARVYVAVTARASATMPCVAPPPAE